MGRDRDQRPLREEENRNTSRQGKNNLSDREPEKTYVKNASASGTGSLGRSDSDYEEELDTNDRIY
jgi:hypothetical protein